MRIIMHYGSARTTTCGTYTDGEAEDYTVNITGGASAGFASANSISKVDINSITIFPNPVKTSLANVVLQVSKAAPVNIMIADLSGRILRTETIASIIAGKNTHALNDLNLMPGTYMIIAKQNNATIARTQFIVAK